MFLSFEVEVELKLKLKLKLWLRSDIYISEYLHTLPTYLLEVHLLPKPQGRRTELGRADIVYIAQEEFTRRML